MKSEDAEEEEDVEGRFRRIKEGWDREKERVNNELAEKGLKVVEPKKKTKAQGETVKLGILGVVEPLGVKTVKEGWEQIEMAVESGAGETVVAEDELQSVETVDGKPRTRG